MSQYIHKRTVMVAKYIADNKCTVREAANAFCYSKTTVHKDVTKRLPYLNNELYSQVRKVLDINKEERHLRGGEATRRKYAIREDCNGC